MVLVRERVMYRELKVGRGRLTMEQEAWLKRLVLAGEDAKIWRPVDWPRIEEELKRGF